MLSIQLTAVICLIFGYSSNNLVTCQKRFALTPGFEVNKLNSNDSELIFAQVIYRHGDRNIGYTFPTDPWRDESHWPEGFEQLTKVGKRQQYKLGKFLRHRYGKLLGEQYSPNKLYVQSTDVDRTIMSAQANLAGLFPPTANETWHDDIPWQPIPVHTTNLKSDSVIYFKEHCPKYRDEIVKFLKESPEVQRIYTKYADKFLYWSKMSGANITTIKHVFDLHKTLIIESIHKKPLQEWVRNEIVQNGVMEYIAGYRLKYPSDTKQLARLHVGFFIKKLLERNAQKINKTLKPDRSLWIYSAHDLTIASVLNALGLLEVNFQIDVITLRSLYQVHIPPYCSSIHIELYKNAADEHYVQYFYRKPEEELLSPLEIPNCGKTCTLNQLYELYNDIIPGEFDSECF